MKFVDDDDDDDDIHFIIDRVSTKTDNIFSFGSHVYITLQTWWQEFLSCWSSIVERPSTRASQAGTLLRFF